MSTRRILLGVDGQAGAANALQLAGAFVAGGAEVQVVLRAPLATAEPFEQVTGREARGALFDAAHEAAMGHIEIARWPDAIVIAPAGAELLARMAAGLAGDLLTTLLLATDRPVLVAPPPTAHAATAANVATLAARGVVLLDADADGQQILGIVQAGVAAAAAPKPLLHRHAVVTAGPTREPIDPVRFISNRSSGRQGFAVAAALHAAGARVTLIAGPSAQQTPAGVRRIDVESAQEMLAATLAAAETADLVVAAAAVADYRVREVATQKIKKGGGRMTLDLVRNPDILMGLRTAYPTLFLAGFAAETERLAEHARGKLESKRLDLIAANRVGRGLAFDTEDNALSVFWPDGGAEIAAAPKADVARQLVALIAERLRRRPLPTQT